MPEPTDPVAPIYVLIPTHTTRHLAPTLAGVANQSRRPDAVVVTCDRVSDDIEALLRTWGDRLELPIVYARRPHQGEARLNQVRNNGFRALDSIGLLTQRNNPGEATHSEARVIVLDGDTVLAPTAVERHAQTGRDVDLVIPYRVDLTPERTTRFTPEAIWGGEMDPEPTEADLALLDKRHRRYVRQLWFKGLGLEKAHKPKIIGGHHSVRVSRYLHVNGYDERFVGYGFDDDDFGKRIYQSGGTSVVAVRDIIAFHLYHPSRKPDRMNRSEAYRRFRDKSLPAACERGFRYPMEQDELVVEILGPAEQLVGRQA
ncbi:MAG: glycosyltransferase [Phycisphaerales bacterium]|nr:glycosyltransferase [Phycisphaerales bacterium]